MGNLPPLPERRYSMLCTKCGYSNPDTSARANAPCENSNCQYFAFVRECDYNDDELRSYAEEAVRLEREQCAKVCDDRSQWIAGTVVPGLLPEFRGADSFANGAWQEAETCAAAIRARSSQVEQGMEG